MAVYPGMTITQRNLDGYGTPPIEWDRVKAVLDSPLPQAPGTGGPQRHTTWLTTTNPDGSPHVMPVGVQSGSRSSLALSMAISIVDAAETTTGRKLSEWAAMGVRIIAGTSGETIGPPALAFATGLVRSDAPNVSYAAVYPMTMLLRIVSAQVLVLWLG